MVKESQIHQVGICPNCSSQARQRFKFGVNECNGIATDRGRPSAYGEVHTLSLFRCDGCNGLLLFKTHYSDFVATDHADGLDPRWVFDLDDLEGGSEFDGDLIYFTRPFQQEPAKEVEPSLPEQVPQTIRDIYDEALSIKDKSPNSFAVQGGRALEAIGNHLGVPRKELEQLESHGPQGIGQLAVRIKDWRNVAAHYDGRTISKEQAEDLDSFFRLLAEYVFVLPNKLREARAKIEIDVDASVHGIH